MSFVNFLKKNFIINQEQYIGYFIAFNQKTPNILKIMKEDLGLEHKKIIFLIEKSLEEGIGLIQTQNKYKVFNEETFNILKNKIQLNCYSIVEYLNHDLNFSLDRIQLFLNQYQKTKKSNTNKGLLFIHQQIFKILNQTKENSFSIDEKKSIKRIMNFYQKYLTSTHQEKDYNLIIKTIDNEATSKNIFLQNYKKFIANFLLLNFSKGDMGLMDIRSSKERIFSKTV